MSKCSSIVRQNALNVGPLAVIVCTKFDVANAATSAQRLACVAFSKPFLTIHLSSIFQY